jgi:TonB-dependent receptor
MGEIMRSCRSALAALLLAAAAAPATAATISGVVFDGGGVKPLPGAEVRIPALGRVAVADAAGAFRFADLPAGAYALEARFAGAEVATQTVTVSQDAAASVAFALAAPGGEAAILVVGQQASLLSAIARQRSSDIVASVLTRDSIGQFPDQNVAEAVRRVPGVNVLNDQGEGRFIAIRGLAPDLNASTVNGVRLPAPESDVRSVALDVIAVDLVESIVIEKSLTPDRDGDAIGGTVEINTTSAFDRRGSYLNLLGEGGYARLRDAVSPKAAMDFGHRFGDRIGIAGGFSWQNRKFSTDNIEADGWSETDDGIVYAEDVEYRDYDVDRERIGATLSLDFRPDDRTKLFVRGLYTRFSDQEFRRRLIFGFDEPSDGAGDRAVFFSEDAEIGVERDLKDRFERQSIRSISVGGETRPGPWTLGFSASYAQASERERGSVDPVTFKRDFEEGDALRVLFDYARLRSPRYAVQSGAAAFFDAGEYEFDELARTTLSDARDRDFAIKGDVGREFALDRGTLTAQGGVKARFRQKRFNGDFDIFDGIDGDLTLADVEGRQSYGLFNVEPTVDPGAWRRFLDDAGYAPFERDDLASEFDSALEDYRADEDVLAGYALGRYETTDLRVIGGVRVERTRTSTRGNAVTLTETEDDEFVTVAPIGFDKRYTDWLPSVNVRYNAAQDLVARFGAYRSLVRPNFAQFAPRFEIEENDEGDREGVFGNPDLDPYRAWNIDATLEWYFSRNAVAQAGVFWKRISDFIVDAEFEDGEFLGVEFSEAVIPINGDTARVIGVEVGYSHALTGLPAPFDGLLVNFNYTFTDTRADIFGRTIPLPASSKHTINAVLGYDKGPVSLRVAGAYRSSYLDELGGDADEDRYVDPHFQIDLTGKYKVNDRVQLFAEFVNANNAKFTAYQRGPGRDRLLQYEEYKWTAKFGARLSF